MGLVNWLSGLLSSNSSEVNQSSEIDIARDDVDGIKTALEENDEVLSQAHQSLNMQDAHDIDLEVIEFEEAIADINMQQNE